MNPSPDLRPVADAAYALRPIGPHDAPALQSLIRNLPPADRRNRFHGAVNELPPAVLQTMTCVDEEREFALVATEPRSGAVIGDARWAIDASGQAAEFAVMVAHASRRRGLGARCIFELRRAAAERGICRLYGFILADNMPMRALMLHCGFSVRPNHVDRGMVIAESHFGPALHGRTRTANRRPPLDSLSNRAAPGRHGLGACAAAFAVLAAGAAFAADAPLPRSPVRTIGGEAMQVIVLPRVEVIGRVVHSGQRKAVSPAPARARVGRSRPAAPDPGRAVALTRAAQLPVPKT